MEYSGVQFQLGFLGYNFCLGGEKLKTLPLMSNFEKIIRLKRISLFRLNQRRRIRINGKIDRIQVTKIFLPICTTRYTRDIKILISKLNVQSYHDSTFFLTTE